MRRSMFLTTTGSLINDVLSRVLDEIEDQDDIGEEESKQLNALCKILHGLDSLFGEIGNVCLKVWFVGSESDAVCRLKSATLFRCGSSSTTSARSSKLRW